MRFALLCYAPFPFPPEWTDEAAEKVMEDHQRSQARHLAERKLGPHLRLMAPSTALTIQSDRDPVVMDGPFTETKEQLLGLWIFEAGSLEEAIEIGKEYAEHGSSVELRPIMEYAPGNLAS